MRLADLIKYYLNQSKGLSTTTMLTLQQRGVSLMEWFIVDPDQFIIIPTIPDSPTDEGWISKPPPVHGRINIRI